MNQHKKILYSASAIIIAVVLFCGGYALGMSEHFHGDTVPGTMRRGVGMMNGNGANGGAQGMYGRGGQPGANGQPAAGQGATGATRGGAIGQVVSNDGKSITITTPSGTSEIVYISSTTSVQTYVSGSTTDIKPGQTVIVQGAPAGDGSVNAQSIQVRPATTQTSATSPSNQ